LANNQNFIIRQGLTVGNTAVINSDGYWTGPVANTELYVHSTGALTCAGLSVDSPNTTFSIGAVTGIIVDNTTNPTSPTITYVSYPGSSGNTSPYLNTDGSTYVLLDSSNNIVLQASIPDTKQRRESIELYEKAGSSLLADIEKKELAIIEEYLPRLGGLWQHDL
jgi:hypothetical protein